MSQLTASEYQSPIGAIDLVFAGEQLVYLDFADNPERYQRLLSQRYPGFSVSISTSRTKVHQALDDYFSGEPAPFKSLVFETGGTSFQRKIWRALQQIPTGQTTDYSTLASRVGSPRAVRAAASSNARNPIAIIIPCHRVIGKDGSLRGYAGGIHRKRWLIDHEQRNAQTGSTN